MYGALLWNRAYLLIQLRTGHSWLATRAKLHHFRDDDKCAYGAAKTMVHVLVDCPKLKDQRQSYRVKLGLYLITNQVCWEEDLKVRKASRLICKTVKS
jgi:predicted secreted Zn-dependent protease